MERTGSDIRLDDVHLIDDVDDNAWDGDLGYQHLVPALDDVDSAYELGKEMYRVDGSLDAPVEYPADESYAKGEQLAVVAAREAVARQDIEEQAAVAAGADQGFRDGYLEWVEDATDAGAEADLVTAGMEELLDAYLEQHPDAVDDAVGVTGTRQDWEDGTSTGIAAGCGGRKKWDRYAEDGMPEGYVVATSDGRRDRHLFAAARQATDAMGIATGDGVADHADVVIEETGDWYGQIGATLLFAGLVHDRDPDAVVDETAAYLGELGVEALPELEQGGADEEVVQYDGEPIGATIADRWQQVRDRVAVTR